MRVRPGSGDVSYLAVRLCRAARRMLGPVAPHSTVAELLAAIESHPLVEDPPRPALRAVPLRASPPGPRELLASLRALASLVDPQWSPNHGSVQE